MQARMQASMAAGPYLQVALRPRCQLFSVCDVGQHTLVTVHSRQVHVRGVAGLPVEVACMRSSSSNSARCSSAHGDQHGRSCMDMGGGSGVGPMLEHSELRWGLLINHRNAVCASCAAQRGPSQGHGAVLPAGQRSASAQHPGQEPCKQNVIYQNRPCS